MGGFLSGLWANRANGIGIRTYFYHGVVEDRKDPRLERNLTLLSDFKSHVDFWRGLKVLDLGELMAELRVPSKRRKPAAVITFDDGYANNLQAAEVLAAARLPWAVFVSTGAVGRENAIWTVELSLLLLHGRAPQVEALGKVWPLSDRQNREATFQAIRYPLKSLPAEARRQALDHIRQQFPQGESQRLLHEFPSLQMLTWEEVGQLARSGVEIGSHGVDHEIHHAQQPEAVRRHELVDSKAELERRLGRPCRAFAFPNGDFNPSSATEVEAAGYDLAFTLEPRPIQPGDHSCLLPRLKPLS